MPPTVRKRPLLQAFIGILGVVLLNAFAAYRATPTPLSVGLLAQGPPPVCVTTPSGPQCSCPTGYADIGGACVDVNECATNNGGCGPTISSICTNTLGSFTCSCQSGYAMVNGLCTDVNECATNNGGCSPVSTCTNTPGSFVCGPCPSGYTGNGFTCTDINECATNNGGCSTNPFVACTNRDGGFMCGPCPVGYAGDGTTCTDINECATNNGGCGPTNTSICTNTVGNFTCSCQSGYAMVNGVCTDVNECATNNGGCFPGSQCTNTPGSRTCGACPAGYAGNGVTCTDINECATNNGGCGANATCTNTPGSFSCTPNDVCTPAPTNLVGWWRGEGDATDATGAYNGTLVGSPAIGFGPGEVGQGFVLDGVAPGYLSLPPIAAVSGNNARTVMFWMKPRADSVAGDQNTPFFYGVPGVSYDAFGIDLDGLSGSGTVQLQMFTWSADDLNGIDTGVPPDQWVHVAVTYDPVAQTIAVYANGNLVASRTLGNALMTSATPIDVGSFPGGGGVPESFFGGSLDEVQIYARALAPSEIQAIVGARTAGLCPIACAPPPSGLVSWWKGDGDASDAYGFNDGTIAGPVTFVPGRVNEAFDISAGGSVQIPFNAGAPPLTVDAWVIVPSTSSPGNAVILGTSGFQLGLVNAAGGFTPAFVSGAASVTAPSQDPYGVFTHLAASDDGTTLTLYVNGKAVAASPSSGGAASTAPLLIGQSFAGLIDEAHLFNRALSAAEISAMYSAGGSGLCTIPPLPRTVTLTWSNPSAITYGTALGSAQLNATAAFNGTPVSGTFAYAPPSGTVLNAGTGIPLNVAFTADDPRYTSATASVTIDVQKATPTITWPNPANITYGTALGPTQLNAAASFNSASIAGTFTYTPPAGTILPVGSGQTLSTTFTPADTTNYVSVSATARITVTPAPVTLTLPADITAEATGPRGAEVTFVATAVDAAGKHLKVTCTPPSGSRFPIGKTTVSCTAKDAAGQTASGSFHVTVRDTKPPKIERLFAVPDVLWPVNNKFVDVRVFAFAFDRVDRHPACKVTSATSNQPGGAQDITLLGGLNVALRAERTGGSDRVYTLTVSCTDEAGNSASKSTTVVVPKNAPGKDDHR